MNLCTISFNFSNLPKNISSLNIGDERVKIEKKKEKKRRESEWFTQGCDPLENND